MKTYRIVLIFSVALSSSYAAFTVQVNDDETNAVDPVTDSEFCIEPLCNLSCWILGAHGGWCIGGACMCNNHMEFTAALQAALGSCSALECEQRCQRIGFPGGACVNDRCKCDILRDAENEISQAAKVDVSQAQAVVHQNADQLLRSEKFNLGSSTSRANCDCIDRNCDYYCFRLHFTGGICVTGSCRCYR